MEDIGKQTLGDYRFGKKIAGSKNRLQNSCVALLFASGKGVIVGAKTIEEINSMYFEINSKTL